MIDRVERSLAEFITEGKKKNREFSVRRNIPGYNEGKTAGLSANDIDEVNVDVDPDFYQFTHLSADSVRYPRWVRYGQIPELLDGRDNNAQKLLTIFQRKVEEGYKAGLDELFDSNNVGDLFNSYKLLESHEDFAELNKGIRFQPPGISREQRIKEEKDSWVVPEGIEGCGISINVKDPKIQKRRRLYAMGLQANMVQAYGKKLEFVPDDDIAFGYLKGGFRGEGLVEKSDDTSDNMSYNSGLRMYLYSNGIIYANLEDLRSPEAMLGLRAGLDGLYVTTEQVTNLVRRRYGNEHWLKKNYNTDLLPMHVERARNAHGVGDQARELRKIDKDQQILIEFGYREAYRLTSKD